MVIAMISMRMVQVAIHQVVHMVTVGNCRMPAARAMNVAGFMSAAIVVWRAAVGVHGADFQSMLVDMAFMRVVQVAIVQIIYVAVVQDGLMAAAGAMDVRMVFMDRVGVHHLDSFRFEAFGDPMAHAGASLA